MVETVLSRDKNWVRWKAESCPKISRKPVSAAKYLESQQNLVDLTAKKPMPAPMGASDFSFLNQPASIESLKYPEKRFRSPSMAEYYKLIQMDELDLDFAGEEERKEIEERKAGRVWRALRASVGEGKRTVLCETLRGSSGTGSGKEGGQEWNLKALIGEDEDDEETKEEEVKKEGDVDGESEDKIVKSTSNAATPAMGTPAAIDGAVATPAANDGAADEQIEEAIGSPKPEHVRRSRLGRRRRARRVLILLKLRLWKLSLRRWMVRLRWTPLRQPLMPVKMHRRRVLKREVQMKMKSWMILHREGWMILRSEIEWG